MIDSTTANPFAILLKFYHTNFSEKLIYSDLEKIARKYGRDGERVKLLGDLRSKYTNFTLPTNVAIEGELVAIVAQRKAQIPYDFMQLLLCGSAVDCSPVEHLKKYDSSSEYFDPKRVLDDKFVITRNKFEKAECFDNVSKFKYIINQMVDIQSGKEAINNTEKTDTVHKKTQRSSEYINAKGDGDNNNNNNNNESSNLLEKIAQNTVGITKTSPFLFLLQV